MKWLHNLSNTDTSDTTPSLSGINTPTESASASEDQPPHVNEKPDPSEPLGIEREIGDDDLEPHEIPDRYLVLKTRLHERRPDLTEPKTFKAKGNKKKSDPTPAPDRAADPEISNLLKRIRKIERDILFDLEDAQEKWSAIRVNILKDAAERKRLGIDDEASGSVRSAGPRVTDDPNLSNIASHGDDTLDLGDFFASLPQETTDGVSGLSKMTITAADGTSVIVRDFGKWSGIGPRRVLEETCRARSVRFCLRLISLLTLNQGSVFKNNLFPTFILWLFVATFDHSPVVSCSRNSCFHNDPWR